MLDHNINIQEIIKIAIHAGTIAMQFHGAEYTIEQKQNKTPVTEADIAINDCLMKELSKYNFPILSEEIRDNFKKRKNADFVWIIDPLDGTSDFMQKTGEFSVMVGLVNKKGESVLGVVYAPMLNELYYAQKNEGAYFYHVAPQIRLNCIGEVGCKLALRSKIKVTEASIKNGKILVSRNHIGEFEQEIARRYNMAQTAAGSAGIKMCWIARGDANLYINSSSKSGLWDICAADVILSESGGNLLDKNNNKIKYNVENVTLLNGYIVINKGNICNII